MYFPGNPYLGENQTVVRAELFADHRQLVGEILQWQKHPKPSKQAAHVEATGMNTSARGDLSEKFVRYFLGEIVNTIRHQIWFRASAQGRFPLHLIWHSDLITT
jgi:hypothetical protein